MVYTANWLHLEWYGTQRPFSATCRRLVVPSTPSNHPIGQGHLHQAGPALQTRLPLPHEERIFETKSTKHRRLQLGKTGLAGSRVASAPGFRLHKPVPCKIWLMARPWLLVLVLGVLVCSSVLTWSARTARLHLGDLNKKPEDFLRLKSDS